MGYLYHGSSTSGITRLEPHQSTHGNYVYATNKELAIIFSGRAGDNLTYSLFRNSRNEPWNLVERIPNVFDIMFNNSASIYTVNNNLFKDINTGFTEFVSETGVDVLNEEKIDNVYQKVKELADREVIKIYYYPNKPENIPKDNSDLIQIVLKYAERENKSICHETFERLLLLHPQLLDKINVIAYSKNNDFIPFKKDDLIDIFDEFIKKQINNPEREQFLESSIISISNIYPEFAEILEDKLNLLSSKKII